MHLHLNLLTLLPFATAFTLNTKTPYWSYTTTSLANTTSERCKTAYSASIACNEYLLALVNANEMRPFLPSMEESNFTDTCTKTCRDSLSEYIQNVETACSSPGDAALKGVGVWGRVEFRNVPVQTVGRILEYNLMSACAVDGSGENCYISQSSVIPSKFNCSWGCAVAYWYNRHEYPYSEWQFGDTSGRNVVIEDDSDRYGRPVNTMNGVLVQHTVFADQMDRAWKVVDACIAGNGSGSGNSSFKTGIEGIAVGVKVGSGLNTTNGTSGLSNNTSSTPAQSGLEEGGAVGIRVAGWAVIMTSVSSLVYLL